MRVLALDTATEACSVALLSDDPSQPGGVQLIERYLELGKSHANQILRMVDSVLAESDIQLCHLHGLAASVGPGAFTGVRISVAVAQGLAFGAGLAVVPVSSLEALALQAVREGAVRTLVCLDARMGEVYWACFAADAARGVIILSPPRVGPPGTVKLPDSPPLASVNARPASAARYRGIGRGFSAYPSLGALPGVEVSSAAARALPTAGHIARLGALRLAAGEGIDPSELRPVYLRDKVAHTEAERRQARPQ
ncbi:MAG: tRNA (adenosine(37)-N6)-threonylcarbamoyltransferase complex dimerization subunit type 1 TsaB [Pseudomonadota bacterium]|nr:tRNA (adenosine(37)-N6)-threonylcarbamoyltransferase complex dimerization subunit type 1 TsaB [Pseudomonadota bacterium]